jgi:hypothetical protein
MRDILGALTFELVATTNAKRDTDRRTIACPALPSRRDEAIHASPIHVSRTRPSTFRADTGVLPLGVMPLANRRTDVIASRRTVRMRQASRRVSR